MEEITLNETNTDFFRLNTSIILRRTYVFSTSSIVKYYLTFDGA